MASVAAPAAGAPPLRIGMRARAPSHRRARAEPARAARSRVLSQALERRHDLVQLRAGRIGERIAPTGSARRNSSASSVRSSSAVTRSPLTRCRNRITRSALRRAGRADGDLAEWLVLGPRRLSLLVQLEQREQRHRDRHPIGARDGLVERERPTLEQLAQMREPLRDADLRRPSCGVCRAAPGSSAARRSPRRAAAGRTRARPRAVMPGVATAAAVPSGSGSRPATRAVTQNLGRRPVTVGIEQPREQLLSGFSGIEIELLGSAPGSINRDFSSSSAAIRTRNSVAASRSSSPFRSRWSTYPITISARSTSSRSTSSRRISVSSRSKGPANTSRSSSRSITRTIAES